MGITCVSQQKAWRSTPVGIRVTIIFAEKVLKPSRNSKVISPFSSKKRLEGNMSLKAVLPASTRYTSGTRPRNTSAKPQSTSFLPCPTTALKTTSWKDSPKFSIPVTLPFHFQLVSYHADCSLVLVLEACNLLTTNDCSYRLEYQGLSHHADPITDFHCTLTMPPKICFIAKLKVT